ncbi:hypothetical protein AB0399_15145 [Streptomyces sp. NPDC088194]|uniref:hypothetical protein n=1 Tax=Streptomyces sp. NPDC088194 TaxID=3154931 RepID=UPI00344B28AB
MGGAAGAGPGSVDAVDPDAIHVEEIDGVHVVRTVGEPAPDPMSIAELGYAMAAQDGTTVTVVVGTESERAWSGLEEVLDGQRPGSFREVLLVLSHAATARADRPAVARRIVERWGVRVVAPDGAALLVPGGSLFVPRRPEDPEETGGGAGAGQNRGWWRFAPEGEPEPLGRQLPAPSWQADLDRLSGTATGETAIHRIPAGVALRPLDEPAPLPGDLAFAVPVGPDRPVVLVGAPGDEVELTPHDVVGALTLLPPPIRSAIRLAPGGNSDLLAAGQLAADTFRIEVEVLTGAPLMTDGLSPDGDTHQVRTVLIGRDGTPAWRPFVESVVCRPQLDGPPVPPLLLRWQPPLRGVGSARTGVLRLSESWQVAVTRSGLRVTRVSGMPIALAERPVDADAPAIELGTPGRPLGSSALPALRTLLAALSPEVRERAVLHLYGDCGTEQARELSRVLSEHGVKRLRTKPPQPAARRPAPPARPHPLPAAPAVPAPGGTRQQPGPRLPARPALPRPSGAGQAGPAPVPVPAPAPVSAPVPPPAAAPAPAPAPVPAPAPAPASDARSAVRSKAVEPPTAPGPIPPRPPAGTAPPALIPPGPVPPQAAPPAPVPPAAVPPMVRRPVLTPSFGLGHRSSAAQREAFRALVPDEVWRGQEEAVERMLGRAATEEMGEWAPHPVDVLAVHLYLTTGDGPLGHLALGAALRAGDPRVLPYAACLASGLGRMVPYRGPAFRSGDALAPERTVPGRLLRAPGPVSALTANLRGPSATTRYAVWSENGRRVRLERGGAQPRTGGAAESADEVVFAPGTTFRVLDVREVRGSGVVLLRDVTSGAGSGAAAEQDRAALLALTEALDEGVPSGSRGRVRRWPARCSGPAGWE